MTLLDTGNKFEVSFQATSPRRGERNLQLLLLHDLEDLDARPAGNGVRLEGVAVVESSCTSSLE